MGVERRRLRSAPEGGAGDGGDDDDGEPGGGEGESEDGGRGGVYARRSHVAFSCSSSSQRALLKVYKEQSEAPNESVDVEVSVAARLVAAAGGDDDGVDGGRPGDGAPGPRAGLVVGAGCHVPAAITSFAGCLFGC